MLSKLYIENIAVIERSEINFSRGFNVLTGETGAGKSILIDSINAVLGQRTSRELIRSGAAKAFVSARFEDISEQTLKALAELGVEPDEDEGCLLLQREIKADGKGSVRINGRPAALALLRDVGRLLINIHGQHENQALMSTDRHIKYLDLIGGCTDKLAEYSAAYAEYKAALSRLQKARMDDAEKARRTDMLKYQINELEDAALTVGEAQELREKRSVIQNAERIADALSESYALVNGGDDTDGAKSLLEQCSALLSDISGIRPEFKALAERTESLVYELEDVSSELYSLNEESEFSPYEIDEIESRLDVLNKISRKYGDEADALKYLEKARKELNELERSEELLNELTKKAAVLKRRTTALAAELTELRKRAADKFTQSVKHELEFLDMPRAALEVSIRPHELKADGADSVEFLLSANPGEPPKPLSKIASGGELSRITLAIKTVLADIDDIDTMIFDEVDTGISGRAAHKVGLKLHEVSRCRQIICITHLAQMAAQADTHLLIKKNISDGRTFTSVTPLTFQERKQELARINGDDMISESMLKTAEELLNNAGIYE